MRSLLKAIVVVGIAAFLVLTVLSLVRSPNKTRLSSVSEVESGTTDDHELHLIDNLFGSGAVSDGRTYSVSLIDENKNKIPTGTELFVQGVLYTDRWGPTDDCSWLLIRGTTVVQHGEADPRTYCYFSVLLDEKGQSGDDLWPGVSLVCNMSPEELKEVTRLYHYGEEVQVHGVYASSLDFEIVPLGLVGGHFGVPVLENCTVAGPTENVVRPSRPASATKQPTEASNQNSSTRSTDIQAQDPAAIINESISQTTSQLAKVTRGQTPDEVVAILGPPASVTMGIKRVYSYPRLKLVFVDGKVSEIYKLGGDIGSGLGAIDVQKNITLPDSQPLPRMNGGVGGLYRIGGGVSAPLPLNSVEADFTDQARRAKYQGVCLVSVIVDEQGNPQNPRVIRGLGMGLDEKAVEAVRKYRFKPTMKDGKVPVPVMITVEVNFRLY